MLHQWRPPLIPLLLLHLQRLLIVSTEAIGWQQPQMFLYSGYLNIYEHNSNYVEPSRVLVGEKYTLEIRMDRTDTYDYLIERCTYNSRHSFIDHNSCLIPNQYFIQKWENDAYGYPGVSKRTLVHFYAPEPLEAIECRVKVIQCCACAERACGKDISRVIERCPQQVVIVHTNKPNAAVAMDATHIVQTQTTLPWWLWMLLALLLLLLLCCCLSSIFYWIYSRRKQKPKQVSAVPPLQPKTEPRPTNGQQSIETTRKKPISPEPALPIPGPATYLPKKPRRHRRPEVVNGKKERIYYTPSESPTDSAHSSASHSRPAIKMIQTRQQQENATTPQGLVRLTRLPGTDPLTPLQQSKSTDNFGMATTTETQRQTTVTQQRLITPMESKASQTSITSKNHQLTSPITNQPQVTGAATIANTGTQQNNGLRPSKELEEGGKMEEHFFTRDYLDEKTREEGYDRVQYRYLQQYTESESG